jgi:hypothetical protein
MRVEKEKEQEMSETLGFMVNTNPYAVALHLRELFTA